MKIARTRIGRAYARFFFFAAILGSTGDFFFAGMRWWVWVIVSGLAVLGWVRLRKEEQES